MIYKMKNCILITVLAVVVSACGTQMKGTKVRAFMQDKARVDQEMTGKVGNWQDAPDARQSPGVKTTRKVFVLQVTQEAGAERPNIRLSRELKNREKNKAAPKQSAPVLSKSNKDSLFDSDVILPNFDDEIFVDENEEPTKTIFVEYTVQKNDTLQKISKKFYDSYAQWPRIYEANTKVMKDPHHIKPGTVLQIPVEE